MLRRCPLLIAGLFACVGCLAPVQERTDRTVGLLSARPFDLGPETESAVPPSEPGQQKGGEAKKPPAPKLTETAVDVQTTALLEQAEPAKVAGERPKFNLKIPDAVPGSEAPLITLPKDKAAAQAEVQRLYPPLPALPEEPKPLPGPDGHPYTLASLQRIAAENSPTLRQAAADVEAARGNVIAARAYPNPTVAFEQDPNSNATSSSAFGFYVDQVVKTAGKLKLASAAAQKDLDNAELALRRARSDLATNVRSAYYAFVVARETARVNRSLTEFTTEIYRLQAELLVGGFAAPYEPAALRAQAYTALVAYKQAIVSEIYTWKQLVSTVGLRQLPYSEVAGRVDRLIPAYDYDTTLVQVLKHHTDVLTARNVIEKARYNLKLAQVTPVPDVDFHVATTKDSSIPPFAWTTGVQVSMPIPIWDQNRGPIMAAQAALVRALEEPHRVETNLTNNFSNAYSNYKNNLDALEYYRRHILPDQVRAYRGVFERRQVDANAQFGDLVAAQQALASSVATYVGLLGSLWTSTVQVADFLQTDDLFQQGKATELPALPDLNELPLWPCPHPIGFAQACAAGGIIVPVSAGVANGAESKNSKPAIVVEPSAVPAQPVVRPPGSKMTPVSP